MPQYEPNPVFVCAVSLPIHYLFVITKRALRAPFTIHMLDLSSASAPDNRLRKRILKATCDLHCVIRKFKKS